MEIYILAGQSNMAGRGSPGDLPSRYQSTAGSTYSDVMCFNAEGDWVPAMEPLHKDVDLRKKDRCGVGPALICARALLELRKASSSSSQGWAIGLVPCAIGGASLDEWQKHYEGIVGDCEVSAGRASYRKEGNRPWEYKPGSKNLFEAMALRIDEALRAAPEGSRLGGMLWYQGETDAAKEDHAHTYYGRFEALVTDVRDLGYPELKIFTVAVTGTTDRLPYLPQVRDAQLAAGSPTGINGVWVTDAFGLPMFTDGLHVLTNAQVELGERLALQVFASAEATASGTGDIQATIESWTRAWVQHDARVSRAEKYICGEVSLAKSKRESKHDPISQVTKDLEELITSLNDRTEGLSTIAAHDGLAISPRPTRFSTGPAAPTDQSGQLLPLEEAQWSPERSMERCGDRLAAFSLPPPPPPPSRENSNVLVGRSTSTKQGVGPCLHSPCFGSSREDSNVLLGRSTSAKQGVGPCLHSPCFGSDGDGGETMTEAGGLSSKCSEVGCQQLAACKDGSGHFPDEGPPSRETGELFQRLQQVGRNYIPEMEKPLHAGYRPGCGFAISVSSQVQFRSFAKLLFFLQPRLSSDDRLLVLGCGAGTCVMASALLYNLDQIQGMTLMQDSFDEVRTLLSVFSDADPTAAAMTSDARGASRSENSRLTEEAVGSRRTPLSNIDLLEGEIADARWDDVSLVFAASCHFDETAMLDIARRCRGVRDSAWVVTLDKPLPVVPSDVKEVVTGGEEFRVVWQCQVMGCFGGSTVAFVHHRRGTTLA